MSDSEHVDEPTEAEAKQDGEDLLQKAFEHDEHARRMMSPEAALLHQNSALLYATMALAEAARDIAESLRGIDRNTGEQYTCGHGYTGYCGYCARSETLGR